MIYLHAWLVLHTEPAAAVLYSSTQVKKRNIETLSRIEEKELWRDFAEDFNTSESPSS